jgi:Na+/proline symporter/signal transduction histidine kinase/CheY-like chemotaxis protein
VSPTIVLIAVFIYISLLFGLARFGDKQYFVERSWVRHPIVYALALGVYCTSWTFYGLVGTASVKGWNFFPILLGPILLFTLGYPLLERIYTVCRQEHIHSVADFLASRYGKRQGVAATISLVVLIATIPYIALQLKAVSDTLLLTIGEDFLASQDLTLMIGLSMIAFTLLFGAKRLDVSGYHSGLMSAIAFESLIKIVVLLTVAIFSLFWFSDTSLGQISPTVGSAMGGIYSVFYQPISWLRFLVETLLSVCAIFCLPRMFHVTFVECLSTQHLKYSRWIFVGYLLVISFCIVIIAAVGNEFFMDDSFSGDAYVIALPLSQQVSWLAVFAFLGGFSAATAMIIVATMTLSHMLSNDVILPLLLRHQKQKKTHHDFSRSLIFFRRLTVVLVVLGAYIYQSVLAENVALTSIGLIAFALVVQLAPGILFGLYWRKGNASGLYAGLIVGLSLWFYTLMVPLLTHAGVISNYLVIEGLLGLDWLRPEHLFNLHFSDSFTRGVLISLGANILFYYWYSMRSMETLVDKIQSAAFTNLEKGAYDQYDSIKLDDLQVLLNEFLGGTVTHTIMVSYHPKDGKTAKHQLIEKSQQALAGIVGVASAQSMIETLYSGKKMAVEEVVNLFGETTKALRFNQEVLSASFENISAGISVIDSDLRLIAWNHRYEKMFNYPEGMLYIGFHVADIMRFNGERGLLGDGDITALIHKRLSYMSEGKAYRVVRFHQDDVVIEIKGQPLPNGGYVTTYDDITEFIRVQKNLENANMNLENRVAERTQMIEEVNKNLLKEIHQRNDIEQKLREAKKIADEANASKTKFLALASHDIMQPLNAASLYASALLDDSVNPRSGVQQDASIVKQLKSAIQNTESIIATLLEVSKLDSGVIQPKLTAFELDAMLSNIIDECRVQQPEGLSIRYCKTSAVVYSDKHYLQRIVQNFVSNAIKYTGKGTVLIGCRRVKDEAGKPSIEICVIDNGIGISENEKLSIFNDFYRVPSNSYDRKNQQVVPGAGLGLSVVARFSELLGHRVRCRSELGKGSCFSVTVPLFFGVMPNRGLNLQSAQQNSLHGLCVAYVDDEPHNLSATSVLLERWHCQMIALNTIDAAHEYAAQAASDPMYVPDVLLMDYQLGQSDITGLDLAQELVDMWSEVVTGYTVPVCLISAATDIGLPEKAAAAGFQFLRKPVKPGRLRALLSQLKERRDLRR